MQNPLFEKRSDTPLAVFRDGTALVLCQGRKNGEKQLTRTVHRIDAFLFKLDADAQVFQLSGVVQAVLRVTGKTANGFCDDQVDFSSFAVCNHAVEIISASGVGAGDAFISINVSQFVVRIPIDVFGVVGHLVFKAVDLLFMVGGNSAISSHPDFSVCHSSSIAQATPCRNVYDFSCHINQSSLLNASYSPLG